MAATTHLILDAGHNIGLVISPVNRRGQLRHGLQREIKGLLVARLVSCSDSLAMAVVESSLSRSHNRELVQALLPGLGSLVVLPDSGDLGLKQLLPHSILFLVPFVLSNMLLDELLEGIAGEVDGGGGRNSKAGNGSKDVSINHI